MWDDVLKTIIRKHSIGAKVNEVELSIRLTRNDSILYLIGADAKPAEMEKALGQKFRKVIIDEGQSYRQDLRKMIYEILEPACADLGGTISMTGTPGDLTKSLFYDVTTGIEKGWSTHRWSAFDNPYMEKQWKAKIDSMIARDPDIVNTPAFKRMYLGQWFVDTEKLVYRFDRTRNVCKELPKGKYYYVMGVDLGHDDDSSIVVCAYSDYDPRLYIVDVFSKSGMDFTDLANAIHAYRLRYDVSKIIVDGANKQGVQEMVRRHNLSLTPADKIAKFDFIDMMNADFRKGNIMLLEGTTEPLMDEYASLIYDDRTLKREEHPSCSNHKADAALYAWRWCYNYAWSKKPVQYAPQSEQKVDEFWKKEEEMVEKQKNYNIFDFDDL